METVLQSSDITFHKFHPFQNLELLLYFPLFWPETPETWNLPGLK